MKRRAITLFYTVILILTLIVPANVSAAAKLALNKKSVTLETSDTLKLKLGKIKATNVTWWSSNKSIATVSKWGTITAKNEGSATITAKYNNKKYTCTIKVVDSSDWVLYETDNPKILAENILKGYVVYKDGKYYCSPEYLEMMENENIVYENDISEGSGKKENILTPDAEFEFKYEDEDKKKAEEQALKDRIKDLMGN